MLRGLFTENLPTKLMALGLAVVVWIFLDQEASQEFTLSEVRLAVLPPRGVAVLRVTSPEAGGERLDGPEGGVIRVTLRGPRGLLSDVRRGIEGRHVLDALPEISSTEVTRVRRKLRSSDFDLPRDVEVTKISPAEVDIEVAQETVRYLRIADGIQDCLQKTPPEGMAVERISFNPTHVRVRGLRHILDRLQAVPIVPVDVSDRSQSFAQRVQLQEQILGTPVTTNETIDMTVTLRAKDEARVVPNVRVEMLFPDVLPVRRDRVRLAGPATATAHVQGPSRAVDALVAARRIRVFADVAGADLSNPPHGTCPLRAFVDAPDLAPLVQVTVDPAQARLDIAE